jgi:predicted NUDIX family NTP pyrophosphohydrolase
MKASSASGKKSAGILLYRRTGRLPEVLLVHPGGPFWKHKDAGAWSIPKGEPDEREDPETAARREFFEETGVELTAPGQALEPVKQKGGKWIHAWAVEGDLDPAALKSNSFEMEWPYRSGIRQSFPEVDRYGWFSFDEARIKINPAQAALLKELEAMIR